jgi:hypothetical protein
MSDGMSHGAFAERSRGETVPAAKRAREVRSAAISDQAPDVADRDRALLCEKLRGDGHPPRVQVLVEAVAELRIRALQLPGRGRERTGDRGERQRATVVAGHDHAREQIQAAMLAERIGVHMFSSD